MRTQTLRAIVQICEGTGSISEGKERKSPTNIKIISEQPWQHSIDRSAGSLIVKFQIQLNFFYEMNAEKAADWLPCLSVIIDVVWLVDLVLGSCRFASTLSNSLGHTEQG
jgi:hypothetical protein